MLISERSGRGQTEVSLCKYRPDGKMSPITCFLTTHTKHKHTYLEEMKHQHPQSLVTTVSCGFVFS